MFILNRVPSKSVEKTPYEIWTKKRPRLSFLKIWGCDACVKHLTPDLISVSLWDILGNPKDIISIIIKRTKCLLLRM